MSEWGRRQLVEEVFVVLSLSLLEAAVFAIIDLTSAPIRGEVRVVYPQVGLAEQLATIAFGLAPVWLVLHLLRRSGEGVRAIGITGDRIGMDVAAGVVLAALVGLAGAAFYVASVAVGINRIVIPVPPTGHWWTVPVIVLGAVQAALLEEVVGAYLITRLREMAWTAVAAVGTAAVLRGAYHLYQGWGGFGGNVALGVLFGTIYVRRGRLWPLIVAHAVLDIGAGIGFLLFGDRLPGL